MCEPMLSQPPPCNLAQTCLRQRHGSAAPLAKARAHEVMVGVGIRPLALPAASMGHAGLASNRWRQAHEAVEKVARDLPVLPASWFMQSAVIRRKDCQPESIQHAAAAEATAAAASAAKCMAGTCTSAMPAHPPLALPSTGCGWRSLPACPANQMGRQDHAQGPTHHCKSHPQQPHALLS